MMIEKSKVPEARYNGNVFASLVKPRLDNFEILLVNAGLFQTILSIYIPNLLLALVHLFQQSEDFCNVESDAELSSFSSSMVCYSLSLSI